MEQNGTVTRVSRIPRCDFPGCDALAYADGATIYGPWAFMCEADFREYGRGLGVGRGQRLLLPDEEIGS